MRLTLVLFRQRFRFNRRIPGNITRGKIRYVPPVTKLRLYDTWKRLCWEEETMMYLKNPYLTEEQDKGYMEELGRDEFWHYVLPKIKNTLENRLIEDHVSHLNVTRKWEE